MPPLPKDCPMDQPKTFYRTILRYLICPTHHPDDRIEELAGFCRDARIEEVMLLFTAEELTTGHPTREELGPWVELLCRTRDRLAEDGVALSLNPWTTTYHTARGRRLKPGQDFTCMVGETGAVSPIAACPLCEAWQSYLCDLFGWVVAEVKPVALWVEDDWRLHNHEPEMGYGGCFCKLHLDRFAAAIGREAVTREELLDAILAPGQPHPWREPWLAVCRDSLLEPARRLRQAITAANPGTRLALMSSGPDTHSIEGRDWHALQKALGDEPSFLTRPHLPPYTEEPPLQTPPAGTRLTLANLAGPLGVYPELENSPRCGIYSKSRRQTAMECLESACYGAHGITVNHFDMMGNGTSLDPHFAPALAAHKPMLNAVVQLGLDDRTALGAKVLYHPQVAAARHAPADAPFSMHRLQNQTTDAARTLATLGIAHGFTDQPDAAGPVVVCDQTLRRFDDSQIETLLGGVLLCDATSTEILCQRGFGPAVGIESVARKTLDETGYAYEEILSDDASRYGLARPRMSASRCSEWIGHFTPGPGADVRSIIRTAAHQAVAPGCVVTPTAQGGTAVCTAYPMGRLQFYMGYFNVFRKTLWQELLFELADDAPLATAVNHPLRVYRNVCDAGEFLGLINPTLDGVEQVTLRMGGQAGPPRSLRVLGEDGQWTQATAEVRQIAPSQQLWTLGRDIAPLAAAYLLWEPA